MVCEHLERNLISLCTRLRDVGWLTASLGWFVTVGKTYIPNEFRLLSTWTDALWMLKCIDHRGLLSSGIFITYAVFRKLLWNFYYMQMNTCNIYVSYEVQQHLNTHESFIQLKMQNIINTKTSVCFSLVFSKGSLPHWFFFFFIIPFLWKVVLLF